jgi:hypothetical protein
VKIGFVILVAAALAWAGWQLVPSAPEPVRYGACEDWMIGCQLMLRAEELKKRNAQEAPAPNTNTDTRGE